jgi:hypothetical protein
MVSSREGPCVFDSFFARLELSYRVRLVQLRKHLSQLRSGLYAQLSDEVAARDEAFAFALLRRV